ncbi:Hypothetical protein FKW44_021064, partial [Caligus rogercresseyi]
LPFQSVSMDMARIGVSSSFSQSLLIKYIGSQAEIYICCLFGWIKFHPFGYESVL